mgnify:CR=1 FL=1
MSPAAIRKLSLIVLMALFLGVGLLFLPACSAPPIVAETCALDRWSEAVPDGSPALYCPTSLVQCDTEHTCFEDPAARRTDADQDLILEVCFVDGERVRSCPRWPR